MNELSVLFKSLESMKINFSSKTKTLSEIKFLYVSEDYSLACYEIRKLIHDLNCSNHAYKDNDKRIQVLSILHNVIVDKNKEHNQEYFNGLVLLVDKHLKDSGFSLDKTIFDEFGENIESPETLKKFTDMAEKIIKSDVKNKEAIATFMSQIFNTHKYLVSLEAYYL